MKTSLRLNNALNIHWSILNSVKSLLSEVTSNISEVGEAVNYVKSLKRKTSSSVLFKTSYDTKHEQVSNFNFINIHRKSKWRKKLWSSSPNLLTDITEMLIGVQILNQRLTLYIINVIISLNLLKTWITLNKHLGDTNDFKDIYEIVSLKENNIRFRTAKNKSRRKIKSSKKYITKRASMQMEQYTDSKFSKGSEVGLN